MESQKINFSYIKHRRLSISEIKELYEDNKDEENLDFVFELIKQKNTIEDLELFYEMFKSLKPKHYFEWVGSHYMDIESIKIVFEKCQDHSVVLMRLLRCQIMQNKENLELRNTIFSSLEKEEVLFYLNNCFIDNDLINIIFNNFNKDEELMYVLYLRKKVRKDEELTFKIIKQLSEKYLIKILEQKYFLKLDILKNIWIRFSTKDIAWAVIQKSNSREDMNFYIEIFNFLEKEHILKYLNPDNNNHLSLDDCYLAYQNFSNEIAVLDKMSNLDIVINDKTLNKVISLKLKELKAD